MSYSFLTIPIELVYRILDYLDEIDLIRSVINVCTRLDMIMDTYPRYLVRLILKLCERSSEFDTKLKYKISYIHL